MQAAVREAGLPTEGAPSRQLRACRRCSTHSPSGSTKCHSRRGNRSALHGRHATRPDQWSCSNACRWPCSRGNTRPCTPCDQQAPAAWLLSSRRLGLEIFFAPKCRPLSGSLLCGGHWSLLPGEDRNASSSFLARSSSALPFPQIVIHLAPYHSRGISFHSTLVTASRRSISCRLYGFHECLLR